MGGESKLPSEEYFFSSLYYFSLPSAFAGFVKFFNKVWLANTLLRGLFGITLFVTSIIAYFILITKIAKCNLLPLGSSVLLIQNRFGSGSTVLIRIP
ncbi:hypothetical protein BDB00DRAFT_819379, partial [Zychaea mexicana]|uniref:uncharacterized protein n=1 Tax=Zychaea mexicana TaxID=64656 RepID=UPI0022FE8054